MSQKVALRATTAAPTFFKPLLSFDELYCDGGIVASNPAAVALHEARTIFPDVCLPSTIIIISSRIYQGLPLITWFSD